ncbi:MAG: hypothetical protein WC030_02960 [Candidatus Paceibacterota bacterium]
MNESPEKPRPTQEQLAEEALFIREGAMYIKTKEGEMKLELTPSQLEGVAKKYADIQFYSEVSAVQPDEVKAIIDSADMPRRLKGDTYDDMGSRSEANREMVGRLTTPDILERAESDPAVKEAVDEFISAVSAAYPKLEEAIASIEDKGLRYNLDHAKANSENGLQNIGEHGVRCCLGDDVGFNHYIKGYDSSFAELPSSVKNALRYVGLRAIQLGIQKTEGKLEKILDGEGVLRFIAEDLAKEKGLRAGDIFRVLLQRLRQDRAI